MRPRRGAFGDGEPIPAEYTRDGRNISPQFGRADLPPGARELVIIFEGITPPGHMDAGFTGSPLYAGLVDVSPKGLELTAGLRGLASGIAFFADTHCGPRDPPGSRPAEESCHSSCSAAAFRMAAERGVQSPRSGRLAGWGRRVLAPSGESPGTLSWLQASTESTDCR
jgi:hypothetical protein